MSSSLWTAEEFVRVLYRGFLGREPDPTGFEYWVDRIRDSETADEILKSFAASPECVSSRPVPDHSDEVMNQVVQSARELVKEETVTIVDVGAKRLDTEMPVYLPLMNNQINCQVIGFEPFEPHLEQTRPVDSEHKVLIRPNFIGDGAKHTFHINEPAETSSLLPFSASVTGKLIHLSDLRTVSTRLVDTVTLDQAVSDLSRIDFLKLDIQGFEYSVLSNAPAVLSRALVVHCEVSFVEIYEAQPLFSEVDALLRSAGFGFIDFDHLCRYAFEDSAAPEALDQLGWGDAVYFKQTDRLEHPRDLLIQSLIALLVYNRRSLASFLAKEYDSRTGESFRSQFRPQAGSCSSHTR